jgi:hypothetical protein
MTVRSITFFMGLLVASTGSAQSEENRALDLEVIPIYVTQPEPGTYKAEVDVVLDGHKRRFILDSGAGKTSVFSDPDTSTYPAVGHDQAGGSSSKAVSVDIIQPQQLGLGHHVFHNPRLQRTGTNRKINLLGLDLLSEHPFQVDLKNAKLSIIASLPRDLSTNPLHRLTDGHIAVPTRLGTKDINGLFDTGADITLVDLQFVKANAQIFKFVRNTEGIDSTGHQQDSPIYEVSSLRIGRLLLKKVEMATYDFGDDFRKKMEGVPIIVGDNVIYHAKWSFDLKQDLWAVEPY